MNDSKVFWECILLFICSVLMEDILCIFFFFVYLVYYRFKDKNGVRGEVVSFYRSDDANEF